MTWADTTLSTAFHTRRAEGISMENSASGPDETNLANLLAQVSLWDVRSSC